MNTEGNITRRPQSKYSLCLSAIENKFSSLQNKSPDYPGLSLFVGMTGLITLIQEWVEAKLFKPSSLSLRYVFLFFRFNKQ